MLKLPKLVKTAFIAVFMLFGLFLLTQPSFANCDPSSGTITSGIDCANNIGVGSIDGRDGLLISVINTLLAVIGIVSVIVIIIGGFKFVLSNGDENATKSARNTVLYAVIGLAVAILAFAIVQFVLNRLV